MKKIICLTLTAFLILLSGCGTKTYSPVINSEFDYGARFVTGDYSFSCIISRKEKTVTVMPTDTYASDMKISCDGTNVLFIQNGMKKSLTLSEASPKNPAAVLYSVFYVLCDGKSYTVKKVESGYQYSGKTDYGVFTLYQKDDNSLDKLILPDKDISVEFN